MKNAIIVRQTPRQVDTMLRAADLAAGLDAAARQLRAEADRLEKHARNERRRAEVDRQMRRAAAADPNADPAAFAALLGLPESAAAAWIARARRRVAADARQDRDRLIMRLAASGWTNARIAARVRLGQTRVSEIIQKGKRSLSRGD